MFLALKKDQILNLMAMGYHLPIAINVDRLTKNNLL